MKKILPFVLFWIVDSLFIYIASIVFPLAFVLGNFRFSIFAAIVWAGLWIAVLGWLANWLVEKSKMKLNGFWQMFIFYWFANSAAIWITAHLATVTGFGIASFVWAIGLGLVLVLVQSAIMKLGKFKM